MKADPHASPADAASAHSRDVTSRRIAWIVLVVALLVPLLWCFGPAMLGRQGFAFRDGAHYYRPLFAWVAGQWNSGQIPLWNPLDNCGVPVLADATSGVFYPPKIVFALPLPYGVTYNLFIIGHVLLAAMTSFHLARSWQTSRLAAGLCGVSYAFGGNVVFQYCNVVYLIGAAWLPLALLAGDRMLARRSLRGAFSLAAILAWMVLGGDPQMAYNAGLLVALHAALMWCCRPSAGHTSASDAARRGPVPPPKAASQLMQHGALLSVAAVFAFLLSAVQVLPSSQWTRQCQRAVFRNPRSVSEIPTLLSRSDAERPGQAIAQGIFGVPARGTHHEHIYHFSVGPWRAAEMVWPNISGQMFPINRRWTNLVPAEGRIWTPSLYAGILPLLLGLSAWRVRGADRIVRWVSWMTLLATVAGLGWYGLGWLLQEFRCGVLGTAPDETLIGAPVGGLYWLMVVFLPGYALFRFPAKLLVIAALGLSVLAARGLDHAIVRRPRGLIVCLRGLAATSLLGLMISFAIAPLWPAWTQGVPADALFGPFDAAGALRDLRLTMLHTTLLAGIGAWIMGRGTRWPPSRIAACLVLVTAVDLAVANSPMVLVAPDDAWQAQGDIPRVIESRTQGDARQPFRVLRASSQLWWPASWTAESNLDRARQGIQWDRATLYPKYHLPHNLALIETYGSCTSYDYLALLRAARKDGPRRPDGVMEGAPNVVNLLGARYLLLPADFAYPGTDQLTPIAGQFVTENAALWHNPGAFPRAWVVHDVVRLPPLPNRDPSNIGKRTRQVLLDKGAPRDFRTTAVVETDGKIDLPTTGDQRMSESMDRNGEFCRVVTDGAQRVRIHARLERPGLLVVSDTFYPGWTAKVSSGDQPAVILPILRTNRVMRGVVLPAGEHDVLFEYRPELFYVGAAISVASWALVSAGFGCLALRRRRRTVQTQQECT